MANRKLRVLLKKIYSNGDIDTIFFRSRAKDVYVDDDGSTTLQDTVDKVNEMQDGATKVEESATNGNIKINGSETQVYKHPNSGATAGTYNKVTVNAEGHVTSGTNVTDWDGTVSGDISNATATFTQASTRENITTGSNVKTILGKIAKYFADLKSLAFVDKVGTANLDSTLTTAYNNRVTTDKVTTSTSINAAGWVADARAIATLQNQINTINSNIYGYLVGCPYYSDDIFNSQPGGRLLYYDGNTKNTPYKAGLTGASEGIAITVGDWGTYLTSFVIPKGANYIYIYSKYNNTINNWRALNI